LKDWKNTKDSIFLADVAMSVIFLCKEVTPANEFNVPASTKANVTIWSNANVLLVLDYQKDVAFHAALKHTTVVVYFVVRSVTPIMYAIIVLKNITVKCVVTTVIIIVLHAKDLCVYGFLHMLVM
jgi:hypothetical protein